MSIFGASISEHADWVMEACQQLGLVSQSQDYLDRRYLSAEHKLANEMVAQWMQQAHMQTWQDGVGNLWGRYKSSTPNAKTLLFGSHLDTVINGGKYDGMLGVLLPIALVNFLHTSAYQFPFNIDIVGFCDEEGTRFGSTLLGSRALTGKWQPEWQHLVDADGISLRKAMDDFGLNFDLVETCKVNPESLLAYLEVHIEQGPVLEANDLPVGVVSAIAGAKRLLVSVTGMAGHAGTVPMQNRNDALVGAAQMIIAVEQHAKQSGVVATVGQIVNRPNAVNVISGNTEFSIDIRSENDNKRNECLQQITDTLTIIAAQRSLTISIEVTHEAPAVHCDPSLTKALKHAMVNSGITPFELLSGAGHDAMAMADICPMAMLFTRCEKGISHHPKESIMTEDILSTLHTLHEFMKGYLLP
jgi:allantoate deiminase